MNRHLVYQAYGPPAIFHELLYSLYSLLNLYQGTPPFTVTVYTDNRDFLADRLPAEVAYRPVDEAIRKDWAGPLDFVHRVKIRLLQDFIGNHSGAVLYLDTDTVFTRPIEPLFEQVESGRFVMHTDEGRIDSGSNPLFRKLDRFLKTRSELGVPSEVVMYNAGALGFRREDADLLEEVLSLSDTLYGAYQKHIMEQLAFSYAMARRKAIFCADGYIFHYWNFKEFRDVLQEFFNANRRRSYPELCRKIDQIDPRRLIQPKLEYQQLPFLQKNWRKLMGTKWKMPAYQIN